MLQLLLCVTPSHVCIKQRNSHWRVQSFAGHSQAIKNGPGSVFPGKFDENNISIAPTMITSTQNPVESDPSRDVSSKAPEHQPEVASKGISLPIAQSANLSGPTRSEHPLQVSVSDSQSTQCATTSNAQNQQEELMIEGGTISITSSYSQGWVFLQIKDCFVGVLFRKVESLVCLHIKKIVEFSYPCHWL